ncbi:MAG: hypothetical protein PHS38_10595 [Bacteroidales bacterium]|nr:hypothetical protein [Bacteroidales bacterium]
MRFSQRIGKTNVREALQIQSIDSVLENRIWNNILNDFFGHRTDGYNGLSERVRICKIIWEEFFELRTDEIPLYSNGEIDPYRVIYYIKNWFFKSEWYEKYDFIEFLGFIDSTENRTEFTENCNNTLKRELAGYRLVENKIMQITAEEEIVEIENAINNSNGHKSVEIHLKTALDLLSNRENPDYRNSIKESISAVESICVIITGDKNATLGKALSIFEKRYGLHGALKNAFSSLYGYASDSGGIRHSLLEDDIAVTMEDAKFMLVSCSAFINYLKTKK